MGAMTVTVYKNKSLTHLLVIMVISFIIASILSIYPLSTSIAFFRPMWLIIALIFWLIFQPARVGVWTAFLIGLIADLLTDSVIGQQALCAVLVAFFIKFISSYIKKLSANLVWALAAACLLLYQACLIILHFFTQTVFAPQLLYSAIISIIIWPLWVAAFARYTR